MRKVHRHKDTGTKHRHKAKITLEMVVGMKNVVPSCGRFKDAVFDWHGGGHTMH